MKLAIIILSTFVLLGCAGSNKHTQEIKTWVNPIDGMVFVRIPAGSFIVQVEDRNTDNEFPFKEIKFDDFYMSSTEVTVAQFRKFTECTGYLTDAEIADSQWNWKNPGFKQLDDHPVVYVSFEDAKAYTAWAEVDLPEEAEWLYACYANTTTKYYWGDEMQPDLFWHRMNSMEGTHPVATNLPNPWGLYDMIGNVKEYCKTIGGGFALPGESWTRCISYTTRHGSVADQLVANSISKLLHIYDPNPVLPQYPWDDDRGIRCVRRGKLRSD